MPISSIVGLSGSIDESSTSRTTSQANSESTSSTPRNTSTPVISDGPAPTLVSSSSPSLTSSAVTETTAAANSQLTTAAAQPQGTPAGSIAGLVIGLLLLVGLILFGVRWYFIRNREHKSTPARSRISRLNISGPSNFTHLQSGAGAADSSATQMATPPPSNRPRATTDASVVAESPYDRIKQKYSFDLNQLETGLSSHMETMKSSRKNAPSQ